MTGAAANDLTTFDSLFGTEAQPRRIAVGADAVDVAAGRDAVWVTNGARPALLTPIAQSAVEFEAAARTNSQAVTSVKNRTNNDQ